MLSVYDVAAYILKKNGPMTAMKLQKLVYYAQAWALVWDEKPLFEEKIKAWANGPVCPELYHRHKGQFEVARIEGGDPDRLEKNQCAMVDGVLDYYGDKPSQSLSDLTHMEDPWKNARFGLSDAERGNVEITHADMAEYYGGLRKKDEKV